MDFWEAVVNTIAPINAVQPSPGRAKQSNGVAALPVAPSVMPACCVARGK
jgi:hypothetical protein